MSDPAPSTPAPALRLVRVAPDHDRVRAILRTVDLPTADLATVDGRFSLAYETGGDDAGTTARAVDPDAGAGAVGPDHDADAGRAPVGVGGIEVADSVGLLRSVAVVPEARGRGVGTALCAAMEDRARAAGAERLYLLTTTAADFFAGVGYARIDRDAVPAPIRATTEFADLCPTTATCMRKRL